VRYAKERNFFIDNDPLRTTAGKEELAFEWKNTFFKRICVSQMINWVAIEEEYHRQLVSIVKTPALVGSLADENALRQKRKQARMLNKEFDQVKDLLKHYLVTQVEQKYDDAKINPQTSKFSEVLTANNFFSIDLDPIGLNTRVKRYAQAFSLKEDQKEVLQIIDRCKAAPNEPITFQTLVLNFNYTGTLKIYEKFLENRVSGYSWVQIHGDLQEPIFGSGDETGEAYEAIENLNDNEYLKNFKSFQYFHSTRYDQLLQHIQSEKYQVCIMGHSCGLSDRVLLKTIFEHQNCRSIKVFYHNRGQGKDTYTDIIQNISRHCSDKAAMRAKIVNKTQCEPLPQLPEKYWSTEKDGSNQSEA